MVNLLDVRPRSRDDAFLRWLLRRNNRRCITERHWQAAVTEYMDMARIIVLDARDLTPAVCDETIMILRAEVLFKTIFLVGRKGERPVLDEIGHLSELENSGAAFLDEDRLIAFIEFAAKKTTHLPTRDRPVARITESL